MRAGLPGGLAAWLGFTVPSAVALILFAYGVALFGDLNHAAWLHGLKIVAVAVVAQAVWGMARNLCPDRPRVTLAIGAALLALAVPGAVGQLGAIAIGALLGHWVAPGAPRQVEGTLGFSLNRRLALGALVVFMALLVGLPLLASATGSHAVELMDRFYRAGSFVFGGGHVVLPLLQQAVVPGLLLAALYDPVWTSAIHGPKDFALGLLAFLLLVFWKVPPWLVVILGALSAAAVGAR